MAWHFPLCLTPILFPMKWAFSILPMKQMYLVQCILGYLNTFVLDTLRKCSDKWICLDKWNPSIGLVTSMDFSLCCQPKPKYNAHLASASHWSSNVFFLMPTLAIFFHNLLRFCDYRQSSTSIALHIGFICSHEFGYIQLLFDNTFSALRVALTIDKTILKDFATVTTHVAFANVGVACEILRSDNQCVR